VGLSFLLCAGASADIYVNGRTGNRDNDGRSEDDALLTIQAGLDRTSSGAVCHIAGEYGGMPIVYSRETNEEDFPIFMKAGVILRGEGNQKPIIESSESTSVFFVRNIEQPTTIEGFKIIGDFG